MLTPDGKWQQVRQKGASPPQIMHANVLEIMNEKEALFREQFKLDKVILPSSFSIFVSFNLFGNFEIFRQL